jgi:uncharacterized protein (TIGR03086 family)
MADLRQLYVKASKIFRDAVHEIKKDQWNASTPCTDWDVRALVKHLVYESLWVPAMLEGKTVAEVGDTYEGDILGNDPVAAWDKADDRARAAVGALDSLESVTHLSFGDYPAEEYLMQALFDLHIHGWDLRTGIGDDTPMDDELTEYLYPWAEKTMEMYRAGGVVGPAPPIPDNASMQTKILAQAGRVG